MFGITGEKDEEKKTKQKLTRDTFYPIPSFSPNVPKNESMLGARGSSKRTPPSLSPSPPLSLPPPI